MVTLGLMESFCRDSVRNGGCKGREESEELFRKTHFRNYSDFSKSDFLQMLVHSSPNPWSFQRDLLNVPLPGGLVFGSSVDPEGQRSLCTWLDNSDESLPGVLDVQFVEREPAEKRCLLSWEQKNNCVLPEDLRDFYLTTDGFTLTWSAKLENEPVPVGCMIINSVAKLRLLAQSNIYSLPSAPTLSDLDFEDALEGSDHHAEPHFDSRSRIFELDCCGGNGRVCLVYKDCTPGDVAHQSEIWFLDRSLYWHFLTFSFTAYYRLMITHLGLPEWQYTFTPYGPSPHAKQWASLYQPLTFQDDPHLDPTGESFLNKLDPAKAFRGKAKPAAPKKKQPAQAPASGGAATKGQGFTGRQSVNKR